MERNDLRAEMSNTWKMIQARAVKRLVKHTTDTFKGVPEVERAEVEAVANGVLDALVETHAQPMLHLTPAAFKGHRNEVRLAWLEWVAEDVRAALGWTAPGGVDAGEPVVETAPAFTVQVFARKRQPWAVVDAAGTEVSTHASQAAAEKALAARIA